MGGSIFFKFFLDNAESYDIMKPSTSEKIMNDKITYNKNLELARKRAKLVKAAPAMLKTLKLAHKALVAINQGTVILAPESFKHEQEQIALAITLADVDNTWKE